MDESQGGKLQSYRMESLGLILDVIIQTTKVAPYCFTPLVTFNMR